MTQFDRGVGDGESFSLEDWKGEVARKIDDGAKSGFPPVSVAAIECV